MKLGWAWFCRGFARWQHASGKNYLESRTNWRWGTLRAWGHDHYRAHPPSSKGWCLWSFLRLPQGEYEVNVFFIAHGNRSTEVVYEIYDLDVQVGELSVNQAGGNGVSRRVCLGVYRCDFGVLKVKMMTSESGYVVSDVIQVKRKRKRRFFY